MCWHRSTTVPVAEYHRSLRNLLSGYLLRKFKSSNGWQKLWVIFTNSCLFFFKTFEDDCPLASLPLLGYSVRFDATFIVKMIWHIVYRHYRKRYNRSKGTFKLILFYRNFPRNLIKVPFFQATTKFKTSSLRANFNSFFETYTYLV